MSACQKFRFGDTEFKEYEFISHLWGNYGNILIDIQKLVLSFKCDNSYVFRHHYIYNEMLWDEMWRVEFASK